MGEESFFEADEENDGEFEAFGGVQGDEGGSLFLFEVVVLAVGGEGAVVEEGLEFFALDGVGAEAVDDALDAFAALLAFVVGFAAALDPLEVFDFLEQAMQDVGGVFPGEIDAVFRAGDEGDEGLDGVAALWGRWCR